MIVVDLIEANKRFEVIHKGLNGYLETKRSSFPRFYFLSNEELLAVSINLSRIINNFDFGWILSQTREPRAVVPHLGKCFENIKDLEFEETSGGFPRITAMLSAEGEKVILTEVWRMRIS